MQTITNILLLNSFDIILLQEVGNTMRKYLVDFLDTYYVVNLLNRGNGQVTLVKKNKVKSIVIEYTTLKRYSMVRCKLLNNLYILLINVHLPWGDKAREEYETDINNVINNKINKDNYYIIIGGDANITNKRHLFPKLESLVDKFDDSKIKTSYSRGQCGDDGIFKLKSKKDQYEFVDHLYISKNINNKKIKMYSKHDNYKLTDKDHDFKDIQPPFNNKEYNIVFWPSDHAMVCVKIELNTDVNLNNKYKTKYLKYKTKYADAKKQ
jgi:hypothetical protein